MGWCRTLESVPLILQGKVLADLSGSHLDFHISKFLYMAGRVREATCSLVSKRKMTGVVLGDVAKGIHSKMKKFADGYLWSGGVGSQGYHPAFSSFRFRRQAEQQV